MSFSAAIAGSLSSMNSAAGATEIIGGNIANAETDGFKTFQTLYNSVVNAAGTSSNGVTNVNRLLAGKQGNIQRTEIATDIAIQGKGMFVVSDGINSDNIFFTKAGSFRRDKDGNFTLPSGHILKAWALDANEQLPAATSIASSLATVNVQQLVSQASSTTRVGTSLNLASSEPVAGNAAMLLELQSPINTLRHPKDVIDRGDYNLTKGEGLRLKVGNSMNEQNVVNLIFDGFSRGLSIDPNGTNLVGLATDQFQINIGNDGWVVERGSGTNNLAVLQNVVAQINATSGNNAVTSRIIGDASSSAVYMLLAPEDINLGVSFSGTNNFNIGLGFSDANNIPRGDFRTSDIETYRFASMENLHDILNSIAGVSSQQDESGRTAFFTENSLFIDNYNPDGNGSDFLAEFGLENAQYARSLYNPYDSDFNMAGGVIEPQFTRDFTIYDAMGNAYTFLMSFIRLGTGEWGTEIYAIDSTVLNQAGRTDGLLQAGTLSFDGVGTLSNKKNADIQQSTHSINDVSASLGATHGQTFIMTVGNNTHIFNYSDGAFSTPVTSASTMAFSPSTTPPVACDIIVTDAAGNSKTWEIPIDFNGNVPNLEVLSSLANNINTVATGPYGVKASVIQDGTSSYISLIGKNAQTGITIQDNTTATNRINGFTSAIGFANGATTNVTNVAGEGTVADINRFNSLYDLNYRINGTGGQSGGVVSKISYNELEGSYRLKINTYREDEEILFDGSLDSVGFPLGNGSNDTIFNALGIRHTASITKISGLDQDVRIAWSSSIGAQDSIIDFNWGEVGNIAGITQVSQGYTVNYINQNGVSTGELTNIEIDSEGYIIANFSNSKTRKIYKLSIADFTNLNGLVAKNGNVYSASKDSGELNLKEAKTEGVGSVLAGTLEGSNVDMGEELANLIQVQRRYQASAKVVNIVDKLLEELIHRAFG